MIILALLLLNIATINATIHESLVQLTAHLRTLGEQTFIHKPSKDEVALTAMLLQANGQLDSLIQELNKKYPDNKEDILESLRNYWAAWLQEDPQNNRPAVYPSGAEINKLQGTNDAFSLLFTKPTKDISKNHRQALRFAFFKQVHDNKDILRQGDLLKTNMNLLAVTPKHIKIDPEVQELLEFMKTSSVKKLKEVYDSVMSVNQDIT